MKRIVKKRGGATVAALVLVSLAGSLDAKTIGIWKDTRIGNMSGVTNTLAKAGWKVEWLEERPAKKGGHDLANAAKLAECDAVFLAGGWGRYFFPPAAARKTFVRYVAAGGGALVSGFRGGYVRTANRPMFPEIAEVCNRLSSSWVGGYGTSPLAKAFGGHAVSCGSNDHLVLKVGPQGEVFAVAGSDPAGAAGDVGLGRAIVYGGHFTYTPGDETSEDNERIFLAMLEYLTARKKPTAKDAAKAADIAETAFLRRERTWDIMLDEHGPDRTAGIIPSARDYVTAEPEALAYKLSYYADFLPSADAQKCRALAAELKKTSEAVNAAAETLKASARTLLNGLDENGLNAFSIKDSEFSQEAVAAKFAALVDTNRLALAEKVLAASRPAVQAEKRRRLEREIAEDLKSVPTLVEKTRAPDPAVRYDAATELGRISPDDKASVQALVKLLEDPEEQIRSQAAMSLGWMRAKDAVGALSKLTTSACRWDCRRAVQALGAIGDARATPTVIKALDHADEEVRRLAALALGHLKAADAKARLLALATDESVKDIILRECAVLALGAIGDASVVPALENLRDLKDDRPRSSRSNKPLVNPLSYGSHAVSQSHMGIRWACTFALKAIAAGGRAERGVRQPEVLRGKDAFYALTKNCNAFAGRIDVGTKAFAGPRRKFLLAHLKEAGFTGVHNAWGWTGMNPETYKDLVREADDLGLIWIDVKPGYCVAAKADAEYRIEQFADIPAFCGFWAEETWPDIGWRKQEVVAYLEKKFGKDWRKTSGFRADELAELDRLFARDAYFAFGVGIDDKRLNANFAPPYDGALRVLTQEVGGELLAAQWKESQDYLHARRKGFAHTFVISTADPSKYIGGNAAFAKLDALGVESYQSFGRGSAYFMERYRDGLPRASMSELYNWYCPSGEHALRGFWQNAIHSKCFFNFALHHIFKHATGEYLWVWGEDRWDRFREVFKRVAKNREFYRIVPSAANVAVVYSERSTSVVKEQNYFQCAVPVRMDQNAMATWVALNQLQIPSDVIYAEGLDAKKLAKYDVLCLANAKFLGEAETAAIREWVRAGGVLIAEGTTSLFDGFTLVRRDNYALADVFGVDWKGTAFREGDTADTFATRHGSKVSAYKVVPGLEDKLHMDDSIQRDVKPLKSIVRAEVTDIALLPGLKAGDEIELDAALGLDKVAPTTAKPAALLDKKHGAIFVNAFGKGRCYFSAANYPLLGHVTSEWEMMPNKFDFWLNVRETLGAMVRGGLAFKGVSPPVEVKDVSSEVEVTVDDQGSRYVVHLLDYDVRSKEVKGATLTMPGERPIKRIWYPDTGTDLALSGRTVRLRDFRVYDLVAIEF